jgi:glycosyltransferase involved in cell wall biosynthesis
MRICLIATEMGGIGAYGGFGVLTREIAGGLAARGLDIYVAVPRQPGQKPVAVVDHLTVVSLPIGLYAGLKPTVPFAGVFRMIDADVYHSQEPSIGMRLAQIAQPDKKHIVTFQDPRTIEDWRKQWASARPRWSEECKFRIRYRRDVVPGVRKADGLYCQAKYIIEKAMKIYRLNRRPGFLPNPMRMPDAQGPKAMEPTVCFVGRWDEIKRPELCLDLAARFPAVTFVVMGVCPNNPERDAALRRRCAQLKNVTAPGWLDAAARNRILAHAWILVNTSTKECLPVSYLEACAHHCAILSHGNADDFASRFGYWAQKGDLEDFARGLAFLTEDNRWKEGGEEGYEYVRHTHEFHAVIQKHIEAYEAALAS